jgi:hypothetical protein
MATFQYPGSDLDNRPKLLGLLGGFWRDVFTGNKLVEDYAFARGQIEQQTFDNLEEAVDCVGRSTTPVYHRQRWRRLQLSAADRNSAVLKYGDGAVYGYQPQTGILYQYGTPAQLPVHSFTLPSDIRHISLACNRITSPSATLTQGVDFIIDSGRIVFRDDPFQNPLFLTEPVYNDAGEVVDSTLDIWLCDVSEEWDYMSVHHGFVVGLQRASSESFNDLVNSILDAIVTGSTIETLQRAVAAWLQTPLAKGNETVELVQSDARHLVVATDANAYLFPLSATALVGVGDTVAPGDPLVETIRCYEFNRGNIPEGLFALSMGQGFVSDTYADNLSFLNQTVPLEVDTSGDKTRVSFELGGFVGDVEAFWDAVHALGVAKDETLANLLDVRGSAATDEPGPASLPATINPLQFLCQYVLRNNAFLVWVKNSQLPPGVDTTQVTWLRKIVPPWTALILLYEFEVETDSLSLADEPADDKLGMTESPSLTRGLEPIEETLLLTNMFTEGPTLRPLGGTCVRGCVGD